MTQLENDIAALVARFADDLFNLVRRAPVGDVASVLRSSTAARSGGTVADWAARYDLSKAEAAILGAVLEGKTRHEIAKSRGTSADTIKKQVHHLLTKTGDRSALAATNRLLRERR